MNEIIKACLVSECESHPEDLITSQDGKRFLCQDHYQEQKESFESQAKSACEGIGLTEDEAEQAVEDYNFEF